MTSSLVPLLNPQTSQRQRDAAAVIEREFRAAGFPVALAAAAIVNAYAESGLNPQAKWGPMYGLFQLDRVNGAGIGMTEAELFDATKNTRAIIAAVKSWQGRTLREAIERGERHPHLLAGLFARDIERPRDKDKVALHREGLTWVVFPGLVSPAGPGSVVLGAAVGGAIANGMQRVRDSQRRMASLIEWRLAAAGLPAEIIVAAIANAYAESGLNPLAVAQEANGTTSAGLFQLNDGKRAAGHDMTLAERQDPEKNIDRMLAVYRAGAGSTLERAYAEGERDIGVFTAAWTERLERPANAEAVGVARRALAYRLFPSWVELRQIAEAAVAKARAATGGGGAVLALVLAASAVGVGIAATRRGRRG